MEWLCELILTSLQASNQSSGNARRQRAKRKLKAANLVWTTQCLDMFGSPKTPSYMHSACCISASGRDERDILDNAKLVCTFSQPLQMLSPKALLQMHAWVSYTSADTHGCRLHQEPLDLLPGVFQVQTLQHKLQRLERVIFVRSLLYLHSCPKRAPCSSLSWTMQNWSAHFRSHFKCWVLRLFCKCMHECLTQALIRTVAGFTKSRLIFFRESFKYKLCDTNSSDLSVWSSFAPFCICTAVPNRLPVLAFADSKRSHCKPLLNWFGGMPSAPNFSTILPQKLESHWTGKVALLVLKEQSHGHVRQILHWGPLIALGFGSRLVFSIIIENRFIWRKVVPGNVSLPVV